MNRSAFQNLLLATLLLLTACHTRRALPVDLKNPEFARLKYRLVQETEAKLIGTDSSKMANGSIEMDLIFNPKGVMSQGELIIEILCERVAVRQHQGGQPFDFEATRASGNQALAPVLNAKMELLLTRFGEVKNFTGIDEAFKKADDNVLDSLKTLLESRINNRAMADIFKQLFGYLTYKPMEAGDNWSRKISNAGRKREYVFKLEKREKDRTKIAMTADISASAAPRYINLGAIKIKSKLKGAETGQLELDPYGWIRSYEIQSATESTVRFKPQKKARSIEIPMQVHNTLRFNRIQ